MKRKRFLVVLAAALGFAIGLATVLRAQEIPPESSVSNCRLAGVRHVCPTSAESAHANRICCCRIEGPETR